MVLTSEICSWSKAYKRAEKWNNKHNNTKARVDDDGNIVFYHNKDRAKEKNNNTKDNNSNQPTSEKTKVVDIYIKHGASNTNTFGGKRGGHVAIGLGDDVYGFTNNKHGSHLIAHGNQGRNSLFEKDSKNDWDQSIDVNMTKISIPVSDEQFEKLQQAYETFYNRASNRNLNFPQKYGYDSPYDYAIIGGRRCASSVYQSLIDAGVLKKQTYILDRMIHAGNPGMLLRYLRILSDRSDWDYESNFKTRRSKDGSEKKYNPYTPNWIDNLFDK